MSSIVVSELEYSHHSGDSLFFDISFGISPGDHAAIVGTNGSGKTTILKILAGELTATGGHLDVQGLVISMSQDIGMSKPDSTLREMLIDVAPPELRDAGHELIKAEHKMTNSSHAELADPDAVAQDAMAYAAALGEWGDLGGYELEASWAAAAQRSVKSSVENFSTRLVSELSGGERKRLVLDLILNSGADVLLLDEPDNYLDIPTRVWLEEEIRNCKSTILMVSHDRSLLEATATKLVVLEGSGVWVHGGSYGSLAQARQDRQARLGNALKRWNDEERRLFRHMKVMKERAAANPGNAKRANAAESRWERFLAAGPPPPPVTDQQIRVKLTGADSARRVLNLAGVAIDNLFLPFSDEIHFGERVGLIGPNGTGKTHLLKALAGDIEPDEGSIGLGPRTSVGSFNQVNDRSDFVGRESFDIVRERLPNDEDAMKALARYGLGGHARQSFKTLSGGQKARLEVLCLELEGHNVLLLDEPTDNLDIESSEALEQALEGFMGTVLAVSHDRTFLASLHRFIMITDDGEVFSIPDYDIAMTALADPAGVAKVGLVKSINN